MRRWFATVVRAASDMGSGLTVRLPGTIGFRSPSFLMFSAMISAPASPNPTASSSQILHMLFSSTSISYWPCMLQHVRMEVPMVKDKVLDNWKKQRARVRAAPPQNTRPHHTGIYPCICTHSLRQAHNMNQPAHRIRDNQSQVCGTRHLHLGSTKPAPACNCSVMNDFTSLDISSYNRTITAATSLTMTSKRDTRLVKASLMRLFQVNCSVDWVKSLNLIAPSALKILHMQMDFERCIPYITTY